MACEVEQRGQKRILKRVTAMTNRLHYPEHDLTLEEVADDVRVSQHDRTYVARRWQLTPAVTDVIVRALNHGLTCVW